MFRRGSYPVTACDLSRVHTSLQWMHLAQRSSTREILYFEVVAAPGYTTIQDLGRPGLASLGVSRGGAFDLLAAIRANALVGNPPEASLLELTWTGPTLRVLQNVTISLEGADLGCRVDGAQVPTGLSWFVRRGSEIVFARGGIVDDGGIRGYMAVAGGFDVPAVLEFSLDIDPCQLWRVRGPRFKFWRRAGRRRGRGRPRTYRWKILAGRNAGPPSRHSHPTLRALSGARRGIRQGSQGLQGGNVYSYRPRR